MTNILTFVVKPGTSEVSICARWRVEAFASVLESSFDNERQSLERLAADQRQQAALIATCNGSACGTWPIVQLEIEARHPVSPWLAGLYIAPEYRRLGVGRALVRAIEQHARNRGNSRLYLYTVMRRDTMSDWVGDPGLD